MILLLQNKCTVDKSEISTMEVFGPCPEGAVFHSACVLAQQVSTIVVEYVLRLHCLGNNS